MGTTVDSESAGIACGLRNHTGTVLQNALFSDQSPSASHGGARDIQKHCFREREKRRKKTRDGRWREGRCRRGKNAEEGEERGRKEGETGVEGEAREKGEAGVEGEAREEGEAGVEGEAGAETGC